MSNIYEYLIACWSTLLQMAPALLLGFLAAGIISAFMSEGFIRRHLGGRGLAPIAKAALLGVPMPLCSCGVLPVAAALKRSGASRGAVVAFLISVPQTGADNIFVVWSLLGLTFALYSPVSAFLSGLFGGTICQYFGGNEVKNGNTNDSFNIERPQKSLVAILKYSYITLLDDIAGALLLGVGIAGLISVVVPNDWISDHIGSGIGSMVLMLLAGIPIYVCSSGSVPIAAAFMEKGASAGAALIFLITGPASNAAGLAAISKLLGLRCLVLFLFSLVLFAFGSGFLLNWLYSFLPAAATLPPPHVHGSGINTPFQLICGVLMLLFILHSLGKRLFRKTTATAPGAIILKIEGMSCNHCARSVREALLAQEGIANVEIDLRNELAHIIPDATGANIDIHVLCDKVEKLGFKCEKA